MKQIKVAQIGMGCRGMGLLETVILPQDGVEVAAVCDSYEDRMQQAADKVEAACGKRPLATQDYRDILKRSDIDAVVITSAWESHIPIAIEAMHAGKYVGMEVGGAYNLKDCWDLVETSEQTGIPCMLLENCCYGKEELMVLNMVRQGVLGEVVHCEGGYRHDLRDEIAQGEKNRHYRLRNYLSRNCENYPTHELGPIAKVLDINRGNRMVSLVSVASKASGLKEYIKMEDNTDKRLLDKQFAQGDVVTTIIRCARGETVTLTLDTTLPRAYSRGFTVQGTLGMYQEDNRSVFLDKTDRDKHFSWQKQWGNADTYYQTYRHPIWERYEQEGIKGGHDGMDWLVFSAFFESVRNKVQPPIDVYDAAAWMSITALSEQSIACGGAPVAIPDFTRGKWLMREPVPESRYQLDSREDG